MREAIILSTFLLTCCGKSTGTPLDSGSAADATTVGADAGASPPPEEARATIGQAGGSVIADYGRFSIQFPDGAFTADTLVTITTVPGNAPGAVGSAYRVDTGGATLARPATLIFSYGERDLKGSAPQLSRLAYRGTDGTWNLMQRTVHDPLRKTLSIESDHFSTWAAVVGWRLEPTGAAVKVGGALRLAVLSCWPEPAAGSDETPLVNECHPGTLMRTSLPHVDGIELGNGSVGTVADNVDALNYRAPARLPALDPITVQVGVDVDTGAGTASLSAPVIVFDDDVYAFEITMSLAQQAVVQEGTSGGTHSKSWNQRISYAGILKKSSSGWTSSGPVLMDLGVNDQEQVNDSGVVVLYREVTSGGMGVFTNAEATGGGPPFDLQIAENAGRISSFKLPKDGSGTNRCTMTVSGNGMDDIYQHPCVFSGYPSTTSFIETLGVDGAFEGGSKRFPVSLCPSDRSLTKGFSTLRWSIQPIVAAP